MTTDNERLPTGFGPSGNKHPKKFEQKNSQEPRAQTIYVKCSCCKNYVSANFLGCGHYICQACTEKKQLSSQQGEHIKCPLPSCSFENNKIEQTLQTDVCEGPDIKAMEDDLWYDPELDDTHYRGLTWPRDEDVVTMQELERQLDKRTLARVKRQLKLPRSPPKEIELAEGANADEIRNVLCARVKGNNDLGLLAIYPSRKLNKVVLETAVGNRDKIESYIKETFGDLLKRLPNKTEVAALLVDISQQGLGAGLEFDLFKPGKEKPADFYVELPINIRVKGDYHEFGEFISGVSDLPRIVTNHDIKIRPVGGQQAGLVLETTAKTYRYMDEEEEEAAGQ